MRTIAGQVRDRDTRYGIPYVNIAIGVIYEGAFAPLGEGTITDDEGNFELTYTPAGDGSERIQFSHIGYQNRVQNPGQLQSGLSNDIMLSATTHEVPEAQVVSTHARMSLWPLALIMGVLGLLALIKSSE